LSIDVAVDLPSQGILFLAKVHDVSNL